MGFLDDLKKAAQDAGSAMQRGVDNLQKPGAPPEPPPVGGEMPGAPPSPPPVASAPPELTVPGTPQATPPMASALPDAPMSGSPLAMPPIAEPQSSSLPQLPAPDGGNVLPPPPAPAQ